MGKAKAVVMVCLTTQKTCERLIRHGREIAIAQNAGLDVVHVSRTGYNILGNPHEGEAMEFLFGASREAGAEMTILKSDNVVDTLVGFATGHGVTHIVLGEPPATRRTELDVARELQMRLPGVTFRIVPQRGGR